MKFTIAQLSVASKAVISLSKTDMPIAVAFKLNRFLTKVAPDLEQAEKQRVELLNKFGKPKEGEPDTFVIPDDKVTDFQSELDKLMSIEVDVDFEKIPFSAFEKINCKIDDINGLVLLTDESK